MCIQMNTLDDVTSKRAIYLTMNKNKPILDGLSTRLAWARKRKNMTQGELADRSGVSRETIAKIETGIIKQPRNIAALASALDIEPAWLQFGAEAIDTLDNSVLEAAFILQSLSDDDREALLGTIRRFGKK